MVRRVPVPLRQIAEERAGIGQEPPHRFAAGRVAAGQAPGIWLSHRIAGEAVPPLNRG
ncbi:MAG TPA: hypothetical protein PK440_19210 [Candidatus Accumulibacter phosphatis]|nr:hypothetical protein [Candidatus Accumulibacter phosphatis]HRQ97097.1 hypothetical protein [Candidatus Accumulibacter phosphatis]